MIYRPSFCNVSELAVCCCKRLIFKKIDEDEKEILEDAAQEALEQIERMNYEQEVRAFGANSIIKLGIAFKGKQVLVVEQDFDLI